VTLLRRRRGGTCPRSRGGEGGRARYRKEGGAGVRQEGVRASQEKNREDEVGD
jgi:hypothetical protein